MVSDVPGSSSVTGAQIMIILKANGLCDFITPPLVHSERSKCEGDCPMICPLIGQIHSPRPQTTTRDLRESQRANSIDLIEKRAKSVLPKRRLRLFGPPKSSSFVSRWA